MIRLSLAATAALALSACQPDEPSLQQIGYFKGENKNRVFVYQAPEGAKPEQVRILAAESMHTDKRMTAAFIFEAEAPNPIDNVTGATNFLAAMTAMFEQNTGWRWHYLHQPSSDEWFYDCAVEQDDICPNR